MAEISQRDQEVLDAYLAWDPSGEQSSSDVSDGLGISRQRLYQVLAKHRVPLKTGRRGSADEVPGGQAVAQAIGEAVLDQLLAARSELAAYRDKYGPLNG